ncbi:hypothetical protein VTN96DRAFT_8411 [Rasamsonia emersonii]|uniref:Pre-mRNA-splicing factor 38B n=1 Tax=Rasamsonia emersonii (strain ATCC 16479 / CBS 393.64 / IMI 116815) TaxID=1408163 RepID=A0A0F4YQ28_RASE3|nr:hypothetical protein T310_6294 [Rasamsonia emersonii CBS 393.64]KKA19723.1 hypothetical protein T310_6294 [Rasamsonia emersonii CBS 393.64]
MPPLEEAIDDPTSNDEYVAQLLARDARDRSLKYSALGLEAYLPRRSTGKPPKPNTRFLKNILRETDSHNAALRRKEEEDARERMRRLHGSTSSRRSGRDRERRESERYRDDDRADRHHSRRLRYEDSVDSDCDDRSRRRRRHHTDSESESDHHRSRRHRHSRRDDRDRSRRRRESSRSPSRSRRERDRNYSRRHRHRHSSRSRSPRSRSPRASRRAYDDDYRDSRDRDSRDRDSRDRDSRERDSRERDRHRNSPSTSYSRDRQRESKDRSPSPLRQTTDHHSSDEDSDPLEDLIGPLPPDAHQRHQTASVPSRGRGAYRSKESNIDAHFAPDYDPNLDVRLEEEDDTASTRPKRRPVAGLMTEDDDWDMALEALRDRAQWKQKGAERLRAAGFGEQVVERWTKDPAFTGTSYEGRIEDVRWAKKGEGREWDRGKVMSDGHYDVKAPW